MHIDVNITAVAAGGDGIARDDEGRVVFVEGGLPGERVRARVTTAKKDFAKAVFVELLGDPSPDRVAPTHECGSCTWQYVSRDGQRRLKVDVVRDALRRIAHLEDVQPTVRVPDGSPLRTTARLGVDAEGRAGYRRRGTHEVVVGPCPALHPLVAELVADRRYPPRAGEVLLRASVATEEQVVVVAPERRLRHAAGPAMTEEVAGRRFLVSAASFFQPGPAVADALVEAVDAAIGEAVGRSGHVVDAYAGVGLFASTIGHRRSAAVTAIEQSPAAVADARFNLGDFRRATVVEGEVGRWRPPAETTVDVVVADPARPGLGRPGVAALTATEAARIVLVSCDPASMARDTSLLRDAGYRLSSVEVVDAFPDTFHIEAVGCFDVS